MLTLYYTFTSRYFVYIVCQVNICSSTIKNKTVGTNVYIRDKSKLKYNKNIALN